MIPVKRKYSLCGSFFDLRNIFVILRKCFAKKLLKCSSVYAIIQIVKPVQEGKIWILITGKTEPRR